MKFIGEKLKSGQKTNRKKKKKIEEFDAHKYVVG